jgi:hypothetical protein
MVRCPLIALQMQALKVGEHMTLVFTKVMDELKRAPDGPEPPPVDRGYWEARGSKATVQLADELVGMVREIDPSLERAGDFRQGRCRASQCSSSGSSK